MPYRKKNEVSDGALLFLSRFDHIFRNTSINEAADKDIIGDVFRHDRSCGDNDIIAQSFSSSSRCGAMPYEDFEALLVEEQNTKLIKQESHDGDQAAVFTGYADRQQHQQRRINEFK